MKRFTETNKWRDPWYRRLSSPAKQLWEYLRDNCDAIGLIEIDLAIATTDCGQEISEKNIAELGDRVQRVGESRYFLPKFISFQYGALSENCPPHKSLIALVRTHRLVKNGLLYHYPSPTLALGTRQDKTGPDKNGQDRKEEGVQGENGRILPTVAMALLWLTDWRGNGADYTESETRSAFLALQANGWMWGRNPVTDFRAALERQIQSDRMKNQKKPTPPAESKQMPEQIKVRKL